LNSVKTKSFSLSVLTPVMIHDAKLSLPPPLQSNFFINSLTIFFELYTCLQFFETPIRQEIPLEIFLNNIDIESDD